MTQRPKDCLCLTIHCLPGTDVQMVGFLKIVPIYLLLSFLSASQDLCEKCRPQTMVFCLVFHLTSIYQMPSRCMRQRRGGDPTFGKWNQYSRSPCNIHRENKCMRISQARGQEWGSQSQVTPGSSPASTISLQKSLGQISPSLNFLICKMEVIRGPFSSSKWKVK